MPLRTIGLFSVAAVLLGFTTVKVLEGREAKGFAAGYAAATAEVETQVLKFNNAFAALQRHSAQEVLKAKEARNEALTQLSSAISDLDRLRNSGRKTTAAPAASTPKPASDAESADWIGGFATCYSRYGAFATDAASWADSVNELQGWVNNVCRLGLCTEQLVNRPAAAQSN